MGREKSGLGGRFLAWRGKNLRAKRRVIGKRNM